MPRRRSRRSTAAAGAGTAGLAFAHLTEVRQSCAYECDCDRRRVARGRRAAPAGGGRWPTRAGHGAARCPGAARPGPRGLPRAPRVPPGGGGDPGGRRALPAPHRAACRRGACRLSHRAARVLVAHSHSLSRGIDPASGDRAPGGAGAELARGCGRRRGRPWHGLRRDRARARERATRLAGARDRGVRAGAPPPPRGRGRAPASERPGWRVLATEVSEPALAVARANAATLGLERLELRAGSWYEPLDRERFDLIVSNPPYVAADDPALADPTLRYEPQLALTPGADALECLRVLARGAPAHLNPGGWLLLEQSGRV